MVTNSKCFECSQHIQQFEIHRNYSLCISINYPNTAFACYALELENPQHIHVPSSEVSLLKTCIQCLTDLLHTMVNWSSTFYG